MTPTPNPPSAEDLEDAKHLPWHTIDRAIARYHETQAEADRAGALAGLDNVLEPWFELVTEAMLDARQHLVKVIIATSPTFARNSVGWCEQIRWPVRGIRSNDRVYLVAPEPNREGDPGRIGGPRLMHLIEFPADAIADATVASKFADQFPGAIDPPVVETSSGSGRVVGRPDPGGRDSRSG